MLKINEAVIVEGKYDKIKLSNILDAFIIETNGFNIFNDKKKIAFIRRLANERGIVIITDSDHSGFMIRNFVSQGIPKDKVKHLYIPDVMGKERRKTQPSKEGKLGVEGIDDETLKNLFNSANIASQDKIIYNNTEKVESSDFFELSLSGRENSKEKKKKLLKALELPEFLSTSSLLSYINYTMTKEEFINLVNSLD